MTVRLMDRTVREMSAPETGNRITYDLEVKGFGVRVTAAGAKAFVLNYRTAGRERRYTIGSYPDWTVAAARERAKDLKRQIDVGADPMGERHEARAAPTVADLARLYREKHLPRKRPLSREADEAMLDRYVLPALARLRVADTKRRDIASLHARLSETTPIAANRCLALVSKMFAVAIAEEWCAQNPCRGIERNQENKRERYLTPAEIGRLTAALDAHPSKASANAIRLLLLTGARRGEVLGALWDQFDLEAGVWVKPAASTKQKKLHRLPLSAPALQLLVRMREAGSGPALFPGRGAGATQGGIKRFWASVCKTAGISNARIHDLRHTHASILASSGLSLPIIGALLGHTQAQTTARYAHLADDPLRAATERVGAIVAGAGRAAR